jgi:hypothetical protein
MIQLIRKNWKIELKNKPFNTDIKPDLICQS